MTHARALDQRPAVPASARPSPDRTVPRFAEDRVGGGDRLARLARIANGSPHVVRQRAIVAGIPRAAAAAGAGTPLPAALRNGVEQLAGVSMADVRVHHGSPLPARIQAHAYAEGGTIHLGPGQDRHLPHEAWHVAQQRQGRVPATGHLPDGAAVNDDPALEAEADHMGLRAASLPEAAVRVAADRTAPLPVVQGKFGFELEMRVLVSKKGPEDATAVNDEDREESTFYDPSPQYSLHNGASFDLVVDHGNGIGRWIQGSGHSRRANTAIVEIVTPPVDEHAVTEDAAARPMEAAAAFAESLETLTNQFTERKPLVADPVDLPAIYVGQRRLAGDEAWQTTTAQVQATYAVKLDRAAGLADALTRDQGPLGADQFQASVGQGSALSTAGAKTEAIMKVLAIKFRDQPQPALESASLKGLLFLMGTYLAAGKAPSEDALDKNMVPLLLRHDLPDAHALLDAPARALLGDEARRKTLRDILLMSYAREQDGKLFAGRRETNDGAGVSQPTCREWIDAVLTGNGVRLHKWFGKAKEVNPEQVGPAGAGRSLAPVMEQRSVRTGASTIDGVPRTDWGPLARRYYRMLRDLNA